MRRRRTACDSCRFLSRHQCVWWLPGHRRLIKWTQEAFSAGGHKAELLPLLERCTRELQGVEAYRTDVRYLRVWVQYVSWWTPAAGSSRGGEPPPRWGALLER